MLLRRSRQVQDVSVRSGLTRPKTGSSFPPQPRQSSHGAQEELLTVTTFELKRLPQVKAQTGLSRSEIYRRVALGTFPAPIKLGERASAWVAAEVDQWISHRIDQRGAKAAA